MSVPPLPSSLVDTLPNSSTPWHVSPKVFPKLQFQPAQTDPYTRCEITPDDPEWNFVTTYFYHDAPTNRIIRRIFCVHNPSSTTRFEASIPIMERESTNPHFTPSWHKESHFPLREQAFKRWQESAQSFSPFFMTSASGRKDMYKNVKIVPLWQGSTEAKCHSICQTGFTFFGKDTLKGGMAEGSTDIGFFGSGIYFTNSAKYAADIYSDGNLLLAWVSMREPFPVVSDKVVLPPQEPSDMRALKGKNAYQNYNAHYVPVISVDPSNKECAIYYPCGPGQSPMCDEYAVFQPAQTLVRFWVELDVALLKNPALKGVSVEELLDSILSLLDNPAIQLSDLAVPLEAKSHALLALHGNSPLSSQDFEFYNCTQKLLSETGSVRDVVQKKLLGLMSSQASSIQKVPAVPALPPIAFGAVKWEKYFGLKVAEPALPADIESILEGPCPFFPGKKVKDTHFLNLVPEGMTLERLEALALNPKEGYKIGFRDKDNKYVKLTLSQLGKTSSGKAHWVLMPHDVIPGSRHKTWKNQQEMAVRYKPQGYELLSVIDGAHSLLLEHIQTGRRFYSDSPYTYTRCVEKVLGGSSQWPAAIGGFASGGLNVHGNVVADESGGLGLARKFF